jgi:hypothetical protein
LVGQFNGCAIPIDHHTRFVGVGRDAGFKLCLVRGTSLFPVGAGFAAVGHGRKFFSRVPCDMLFFCITRPCAAARMIFRPSRKIPKRPFDALGGIWHRPWQGWGNRCYPFPVGGSSLSYSP